MPTPRLMGVTAAFAVCAVFAPTTQASLLFSSAEGRREAQVTFEINGTDLIITLANISGFDVERPSELLTGVFFDLTTPTSGPLELSPTSATVESPDQVLFGTTGPNGNVGGEWAFVSALENAPGIAAYGISSSGLGLFGPHDLFPGANLDGPESPGGMSFGITSQGDDPTVGNKPVTGSNPLIKHKVTFVLSDLPIGFSEADIGNVWVQYGTSLSEPSFQVLLVPTPGSIALFGFSALLVARRRRRT